MRVVKGRKTPYQRYLSDLNSSSRNSLLRIFQQSLETVYPKIAAAAKVHIITKATLSGNTCNEFIPSDVEIFLIQLFGYNALLNLQLGGYYCNYLSSAENDELFKSLQTNYIKRYLLEAGPLPIQKVSAIYAPFRTLQREAVAAGHNSNDDI